MSRRRVAIYGAGALGRQLQKRLRTHLAAEVEVIGFIDDMRGAGEPVVDGLLTLGSLDQALASPAHGPDGAELLFAIGYTSMPARRAALERARGAGYRLFTMIDPRAAVEPDAVIGPGCVVLAQAVIDHEVEIGAASFIDVAVRLTWGTRVGCNNYFSGGTATGSRVVIGDDNFFGMDCTITTDVRMGSNLFVNAKTLVPRDVGDDVKLVQVHKSRELPMPRG